MILELNEKEREALATIISNELPRLLVEIHRTEDRNYRLMLEEREGHLRSIQHQLESAGALV